MIMCISDNLVIKKHNSTVIAAERQRECSPCVISSNAAPLLTCVQELSCIKRRSHAGPGDAAGTWAPAWGLSISWRGVLRVSWLLHPRRAALQLSVMRGWGRERAVCVSGCIFSLKIPPASCPVRGLRKSLAVPALPLHVPS